MRKVWFLPSVIAFPMATLVLLSMVIGQMWGNPADGFANLTDCRLPCWNGIRLGETSVGEADERLHNMGYHVLPIDSPKGIPNQTTYETDTVAAGVCMVGVSRSRFLSTKIAEMTLQICEGATLGHIVDMLGEPETIIPLVSLVSYHNGEVAIILRSEICQTHEITPRNDILFISLTQTQPVSSALSAELTLEKQTFSSMLPWRGFMPLWRYGDLYPGRNLCF